MTFRFGALFLLVLFICFNVNAVDSDDGEFLVFTFYSFLFWNGDILTVFKVSNMKLCLQVVTFLNCVVSLFQSQIFHVPFSLFFWWRVLDKTPKAWIFNWFVYSCLLGFFIPNQMGYSLSIFSNSPNFLIVKSQHLFFSLLNII